MWLDTMTLNLWHVIYLYNLLHDIHNQSLHFPLRKCHTCGWILWHWISEVFCNKCIGFRTCLWQDTIITGFLHIWYTFAVLSFIWSTFLIQASIHIFFGIEISSIHFCGLLSKLFFVLISASSSAWIDFADY